ncbi:MAG: DUF1292 domain-containing protein [Coriobacteriales bacterium]|nr:DUF1292 domain-containing protein [Coriobacteriales bacterium]
MADLDSVLNNDQEFEDENLVLTNDEGIDEEFEYIDTIDYEGEEYVVFIPVEEDEEGMAEVLILKVEELEAEDGQEPEEQYVTIDDEDLLDKLFEIFKKDHIDEFDFFEE